MSFEEISSKFEIEDFSEIASKLEGEISINNYLKYKIVKNKKDDDEDEDEENFDWYNPNSDTSYACLVTNNSM